MRITIKHLTAATRRLNALVKRPVNPLNGMLTPNDPIWNAGTYFIESGFGGHSLMKVVNSEGIMVNVIGGYLPARDLLARLEAFITGVHVGMDTTR